MTNPNITPSSPRKKMLRALLVAPIAVGALAGALAAGTGISAAAPTDPSSGDSIAWRVHNYTGQDITAGIFGKAATGGPMSTLYVEDMKPGGVKGGTYQSGKDPGTGATICFNNTLWELKRTDTPGDKWNDVYVFFRGGKLFLTPEGAVDNKIMSPYGDC
ncbi:hypothetical protein R3Q06_25495 [Rhodococcus erythropolis]|uniref:hypothetical protein n=1 Tax=Rhodococcus erythropolis TaxID=1833 RepID=UPI00294972DA|nr:hypothetical protein [Rhodococcus erythropolis]MDV6276854.1 hypothetical protein [Rhodococcus erythropolis]